MEEAEDQITDVWGFLNTKSIPEHCLSEPEDDNPSTFLLPPSSDLTHADNSSAISSSNSSPTNAHSCSEDDVEVVREYDTSDNEEGVIG